MKRTWAEFTNMGPKGKFLNWIRTCPDLLVAFKLWMCGDNFEIRKSSEGITTSLY